MNNINKLQKHIHRVVFGGVSSDTDKSLKHQSIVDYALVGPFDSEVLYSLKNASFVGKPNFSISWLWRRGFCYMDGSQSYSISEKGEQLLRCCKAIDYLLGKPEVEPVNKVWEIWCEGYNAIGEHRTAFLVDREMGSTFKDAVDRLSRKHGEASLFNLDKMLYDGRRIFDNERGARKNYG